MAMYVWRCCTYIHTRSLYWLILATLLNTMLTRAGTVKNCWMLASTYIVSGFCEVYSHIIFLPHTHMLIFSLSLFLQEFARTDWTGYCLSHLFTARPYSDSSTLGVAYTAFSYIKSGGVCAEGKFYWILLI